MLTPNQLSIIEAPTNAKIFLTGVAGTGKTTTGVERMRALLNAGVPGDSILMLTPQRTLQEPYLDLLRSPERGAGGEVTPATMGGLARRMVDLFWPLAAESAGFVYPDRPPVFLTLETAQYYMARLVRPLLAEGYFESVTMERNRIYSQILDNLNKAAIIGFPHTEIGARLDLAYAGELAQRRLYADVQDCANRFRAYCLEYNLLDFSLQLDVFTNILWPQPSARAYLTRSYRHLIYDNVEEDGARAHDVIYEWLPEFESALLICDAGSGYRHFLGADAASAERFRDVTQPVTLDESFVQSEPVIALEEHLAHAIDPALPPSDRPLALPGRANESGEPAFDFLVSRFYPELLDIVVQKARFLIDEEHIPPAEIVILAPYLSDALRFALMNRLQAAGVPTRSHRPSRSLRDEPASHALLTLAALAHPQWDIHPPKFDVAYALMQSIAGLDLVRAQLLTEIVYRQRDLALAPFDGIKAEVQERITYLIGSRYTLLRAWVTEYRPSAPLPLDHFLRKLFGEVLSQPGFGFHSDFDAVRVAASLVESVRKFRVALDPTETADSEYIAMLADGVIAAQSLEAWSAADKNAVLVAPAYTFLMMNQPATVQFWLDAGASGWYERLSQPLTHPYVLSRQWQSVTPGRVWGDADEVQASQEAMARLAAGLLRRCRAKVYLGLPDLGETGFEQRGLLLRAFNRVLQGK